MPTDICMPKNEPMHILTQEPLIIFNPLFVNISLAKHNENNLSNHNDLPITSNKYISNNNKTTSELLEDNLQNMKLNKNNLTLSQIPLTSGDAYAIGVDQDVLMNEAIGNLESVYIYL
jgi:hypothetical protein